MQLPPSPASFCIPSAMHPHRPPTLAWAWIPLHGSPPGATYGSAGPALQPTGNARTGGTSYGCIGLLPFAIRDWRATWVVGVLSPATRDPAFFVGVLSSATYNPAFFVGVLSPATRDPALFVGVLSPATSDPAFLVSVLPPATSDPACVVGVLRQPRPRHPHSQRAVTWMTCSLWAVRLVRPHLYCTASFAHTSNAPPRAPTPLLHRLMRPHLHCTASCAHTSTAPPHLSTPLMLRLVRPHLYCTASCAHTSTARPQAPTPLLHRLMRSQPTILLRCPRTGSSSGRRLGACGPTFGCGLCTRRSRPT
eukprot:363121-Chlamydomonas_euryale.AAC.4